MNGFKISAAYDPKGLRFFKRERKNQKYPIYLRIYKDVPKFIKLDLDNIEEKYWEGQKTGKKWVKTNFKEQKFYNDYIELCIYRIKDFIKESTINGSNLSAQEIKNWYEIKFLGKKGDSRVMLKVGDISVQEYFSHAIKDLANSKMPNTIKVYTTTKKQLAHHAPNEIMGNINREFIRGFISYLRNDQKLRDNSIKKSIDKLRKVYEMYCSASERAFNTYYFKDLGIKATGISEEHVSLTDKEYNDIFNLKIEDDELLQGVRNIFLFLCNTGLYYNDLKKCKKSDINFLEGNKDYMVLKENRTKTGKGFWIPLNSASKALMEKFSRESNNFIINRELRIADQTFNKKLKELATLAKTNKNLTVKVARKRFADWTKAIKLHPDYRNDMAGVLPKGVLDRNYTDIRNEKTYLEIIEKLDGEEKATDN